ncbi:MAG: exodeoxyribonuclease VII small subunit [Bacteroidales bacterium]|nr:exodeoxyribonuclease VII small subunit [Bacteroidales bacterium]
MEESKEMTYAAALRELEGIVAKMESNQCDIDSLSGYTTRALELLKFCKQRLFKVDEEVEKCLAALKDTLEAEQ